MLSIVRKTCWKGNYQHKIRSTRTVENALKKSRDCFRTSLDYGDISCILKVRKSPHLNSMGKTNFLDYQSVGYCCSCRTGRTVTGKGTCSQREYMPRQHQTFNSSFRTSRRLCDKVCSLMNHLSTIYSCVLLILELTPAILQQQQQLQDFKETGMWTQQLL